MPAFFFFFLPVGSVSAVLFVAGPAILGRSRRGSGNQSSDLQLSERNSRGTFVILFLFVCLFVCLLCLFLSFTRKMSN